MDIPTLIENLEKACHAYNTPDTESGGSSQLDSSLEALSDVYALVKDAYTLLQTVPEIN